MKISLRIAATAASALLLVQSPLAAQTDQSVGSETAEQSTLGLSEDEIIGIAGQAYLMGTPVAEIARLRSHPFWTGNGTNEAQRNRFTHLRSIIPAGTGNCCPNQDTLYSLAWLDVSEEPLVLTIPPTGGRYFVAHVTDIYTRNRPALSRRTTGSDGGQYLITGPNWKGEVPAGMTQYPLVTNEGLILLRIAPNGMDDLQAVNALQDRVTLSHPSGRAISSELYRAHNPEDPFETFRQLDEALRVSPATGRDGGLAKTFSNLGIGGQAPFDPESLLPWERYAFLKARASNQTMLVRHLPNVGEMRNGWLYVVPGDRFVNDTLARATVALSYILPNDADEALYPIGTVDSEGRQLNSAHNYRLRFSGPVPAEAFWSLIAYDFPAVRLIPNSFGKYSVGDRTESLVVNPDGSTELYFGRQPTAGVPQANWLPVPEGDFSVILRLYEPAPEVVDGSWSPPAIERLD